MSAVAMLDEQERRDAEAFRRAYRALRDTSLPDDENPLLAPALLDFSRRLVASSRGPVFGPQTRLPYVIWKGGVGNNGRDYCWDDEAKKKIYEPVPGLKFHSVKHKKYIVPHGTVANIENVLRSRAEEIAEKHKGWIIHFTVNPNGFRDNENTLEVHALVLDSDDRGEWFSMLANLAAMGVGYIAYQSGGHGPGCAKWRIILPLARPYDCREKRAKEAWNEFYFKVRVVFGSLAQLRKKGFDANTCAVANNWYLTERRSPDAAKREVHVHYGASLDIVQLALGLPDIEEPLRERTRTAPLDIEESAVTDEEYDLIVCAMSEILKGMTKHRRDFCFYLADALVDHGIPLDDVYRIIEDLWSVYGDKVQGAAKRIVDQIAKGWESGEKVIGNHSGALAKYFPQAMEDLALAIPDRVADRHEAWLASEAHQKWMADREAEAAEFSSHLVEINERNTELASQKIPPLPPRPPVPPPEFATPPRPPASLVPPDLLAQTSGCRDLPSSRLPQVPEPVAADPSLKTRSSFDPLPRSVEIVKLCREVAKRAKEDKKTARIGETIELITDSQKIPASEAKVFPRVEAVCAYLGRMLPGRISWETLFEMFRNTLFNHRGLDTEENVKKMREAFEAKHQERIQWEAKAPERLEARLVKRDQAHASALAAVLARCPGGLQKGR